VPVFCKLVLKASGGLGAGASWWQHWLVSDVGTIEDPPDLVTALVARVSSNLEPVLSDAWSLGRVDWTYWATEISVPIPTQVETFTAITGNETATAALAPRQTMMIEYKHMVGNLGPKRCYVGRYAEAHNDTGGVPNGTLVAAVQAYADDTIGELSVNGRAWHFSVVRLARAETAGGQVYYHPDEWASLTGHLVQTKWAFLRSRDVGRGI